MATLEINGIKIYGYHGCFEEEQQIGQHYFIDILIHADIDEACKADNLDATIDYAVIYSIVKQEMLPSARLIEHVAYRIKQALLQQFSNIKDLKVSVSKPLPPVAGNIQHVKVTV